MKKILLTQSLAALVDDEDFETLNAHKWFAHREGHNYYAMRNVRRLDGGKALEYMHRVVLARKLGGVIPKEKMCDHENRDGLDNRRENLREATSGQNKRNCRRHAENPASQFLGVYWDKIHKKWVTQIGISGKRLSLGYFATESDAARAREKHIVAHPELMARSNFPQSPESA